MGEYKQVKYYFDKDLAVMLADKIFPIYSGFRKKVFVKEIDLAVNDQELKLTF